MARGVVAALAAVSALALVPSAFALPLRTGFVDPLSFTSANADASFARAKGAGASTVKLLLMWNEVAPPGPVKPPGLDATDPASPLYNQVAWARFDAQVRRARAHGLDPLVYVYGAPRWAERGNGGPAGTNNPSPEEFGAFAQAAARRYSGTFVPTPSLDGQPLPRVQHWQAWNEPNRDYFFMPQYEGGRLVAPDLYRALVNAFARGVRGVNAGNVVVAGGLAPYAREGKPAPLAFMRALLSKPVAFDVWAHHPYTSGGPTRKAAARDDVSLGNLPKMRAVLRSAARASRVVSSRPVGFWVTEFSWDTKPPDPRGLPSALHARWVSEALYRMWKNGVSTVIWFKVEDEPLATSPYQSGFYTVGGTPKRSLTAFRFPLVAFPSSRGISVWGRTPTGASGRIVVELKVGKSWRRIGTIRANGNGIFQKTYRSPARKGSVRARFGGAASLPFSLTPVRDRTVNPFGCGGGLPC